MKFTDKTVTQSKPALPEGKADKIFFDERLKGFGLRVRAGSDVKVWLYQYSLHNKTQRVKIGEWPAMTPADAFERAQALHRDRHAGVNVAHVKAERQAVRETFGDVVGQYLAARETKLRARTHEESTRYLEKVAKSLHATPLALVTQADVAKLLNSVAEKSESSAGQLRGKLSALFSWACAQGKLASNPVEHTEQRETSRRERVLSDAELAAVWHAADDQNGDFGAIVKLLVLTGQRRSEIGGLRWSEIVGDEINLPGERTKNKQPHNIPVSAAVAEIIAAQPRLRDHLFGRGDSSNGFVGWSAAKAALDARLPGMAKWGLHDLRRTMVTKMNDTGMAPPHIIEAIVNHTSGHKAGVAGTYNKAAYNGQRREALEAWASYVLALVAKPKPKAVGGAARRR
jgi:integrase